MKIINLITEIIISVMIITMPYWILYYLSYALGN